MQDNNYSFIVKPQSEREIQCQTMQSAIFGTNSIISSSIGYIQAPQQFFIQLLESFGPVLAKVKAMKIIGTDSIILESQKYLKESVQFILLNTCQARKEYSQKNKLHEYYSAREQWIFWIDQIIQFMNNDDYRQELEQMKEDREIQQFTSCFKFKQQELYETNTIYNQSIELDKSLNKYIDLIQSDSLKIAQQAYPHIFVMLAEFKDILLLNLIYQIQQNNYIQQQLIEKIRNYKDIRDFNQQLQQLTQIYPILKSMYEEFQEIRQNQRNQITQLDNFQIQQLQLIYDVCTTQINKKDINKEYIISNEVSTFLHHILQVIKAQQKDQIKFITILKSQFQSQLMIQYSQQFQFIADYIYSSKLKLLLLSFGSGIFQEDYISFYQLFVQTDINVLTDFANSTKEYKQNVSQNKQLEEFKISEGELLQYQCLYNIFQQILKLEIAVQQKNKYTILEQQHQLDIILNENQKICEFINQKLYTLNNKTKNKNKTINIQYHIKMFLRYFKISEQSLIPLLKSSSEKPENTYIKQQSSIIKNQQNNDTKIIQSVSMKQKQSQNYLNLINEINNLENNQELYEKPNIYDLFHKIQLCQQNQTIEDQPKKYEVESEIK